MNEITTQVNFPANCARCNRNVGSERWPITATYSANSTNLTWTGETEYKYKGTSNVKWA